MEVILTFTFVLETLNCVRSNDLEVVNMKNQAYANILNITSIVNIQNKSRVAVLK